MNGYAYTIVRPSEKNLPEDKETKRKYRDGKLEIKIIK
jgi:hypothetical protein